MTLREVADTIKKAPERVILIYAPNGTGKTMLSVEYKNVTKEDNDDEHAGVYYNAYSEDLFVWDNDMPGGEQYVKLDIKPSTLNHFYKKLKTEDIKNKLAPYYPRYDFDMLPEDGTRIDFIIFYKKGDEKKKAIKISRGEERIFIWCFFLALFEVDGWANQQHKHFFIDDPVSSMDDNNIYNTAVSIEKIIKDHSGKRKIILTTHHLGLYGYINEWIYNSRDYKSKTKKFILQRDGEDFLLEADNNEVMLYHLFLYQTLYKASKKQLYTYHYALLRQLLETVASFIGYSKFGEVLKIIGVKNHDKLANRINSESHRKGYYLRTEKADETDKAYFDDVLTKLKDTFKFNVQPD